MWQKDVIFDTSTIYVRVYLISLNAGFLRRGSHLVSSNNLKSTIMKLQHK